jgi:hypothetical protein
MMGIKIITLPGKIEKKGKLVSKFPKMVTTR